MLEFLSVVISANGVFTMGWLVIAQNWVSMKLGGGPKREPITFLVCKVGPFQHFL